jgi:hypothetical protein
MLPARHALAMVLVCARCWRECVEVAVMLAGTLPAVVVRPEAEIRGLSTSALDRDRLLAIKQRWFSLCVTGEDKVARFDLIVAGEAGFHERLVGRFAVLEVSEAPTARCGVLFCVLDHKLNVRWGAGYERLGLAKDFVVFLRRHVPVMQKRQ